jgi:hypothetical protein
MDLSNNAIRWQLIREFKQITGIRLKLDGILCALSSRAEIDILNLDKQLTEQSNRSSDKAKYNGEKCTYGKRTNVSMAAYLGYRYGKRAVEIISLLMKPVLITKKETENGTQTRVQG